MSDTAKGRAVTTPSSDKAPIGKVLVKDQLSFEAERVYRKGFDKYPLPERDRVKIGWRIENRDGSAGPKGEFAFAGPSFPVKATAAITREELRRAASITLFGKPYGHVALLPERPGGLARGLLRYPMTYDVAPDAPPKNIRVIAQVMESVAWFIVNEMNQNKRSQVVAECRRLNEEGSHKRAKFLWAGKVHTKAGASGVLGDLFVGDGAWDHKPIIEPVWGTDNRLGDVAHTYFYDIWSNIHFGYVGLAAGFSRAELTNGAGWQQIFDSFSDDDKTDTEAIEAGCLLYDPNKDVTVDEVTDLVEGCAEWRSDARKNKKK